MEPLQCVLGTCIDLVKILLLLKSCWKVLCSNSPRFECLWQKALVIYHFNEVFYTTSFFISSNILQVTFCLLDLPTNREGKEEGESCRKLLGRKLLMMCCCCCCCCCSSRCCSSRCRSRSYILDAVKQQQGFSTSKHVFV